MAQSGGKIWTNSQAPEVRTVLYKRSVACKWDEGKVHHHCGFNNFCNNCYINSSIQALFHIPSFVDFLDNDWAHRAQCKLQQNCLACTLHQIYCRSRLQRIIKLEALVNMLPKIGYQFRKGLMEDAQEFIVHLLVCLEEEILLRAGKEYLKKIDYVSKQTNAMGQIFGGWLLNTDECVQCKKVHFSYMHIRSVFVLPAYGSVQGALDASFNLDECMEYTCSNSCIQKQCKRTTKMWLFPKVLQIVIERFDNDRQKIGYSVDINYSITIGTARYSLSSAVIHYGDSLEGGHFTCVGVCPDGALTYFNDAEVNRGRNYFDTPEMKSGVYVTFYQLQQDSKQSTKRPLPFTPTKSPSHVRKLKLSPSVAVKKPPAIPPLQPTRFPKKTLLFPVPDVPSRDISKSLKDSLFDDDVLAKPLHYCEGDGNNKNLGSATSHQRLISGNSCTDVIPVRLLPKSSERENNNNTEGLISPLKIRRRLRTAPKSTASQSSHEYSVIHQSVDDNEERIASDVESDQESGSTEEARLTPLRIKRSVRTAPKLSSSQSNHEYTVVKDDDVSFLDASDKKVESDVNSDTTADAIVSPIRLARNIKPLFKSAKCAPVFALFNKLTLENSEIVTPQANAKEETVTCLPPGDVGIELPFVPITLEPSDVPGGNLPFAETAKNTVPNLKRWLYLRNMPQVGIKSDLVKRVDECKKTGKDKEIDPKADGGKWYRKKKDHFLSSQDASKLPDDTIFPKHGWEPFPSREIPQNFNFGSVYNYLIETMPDYVDENFNEEDSAEEIGNQEVDVNLEDLGTSLTEERAILKSKKLRRGVQYVKSGFVRGIEDSLPGCFHLYKAHIRSSMKQKAYWVKVAMSQISGSITRGHCECPASAMGRCSHVSALLLHILTHKRLNGCEAITCTSRPCAWNKGSLQHDPSDASKKQYDSFKINVIRRSSFDVRPLALQNRPVQDRINSLLAAISYKEDTCGFQAHLQLKYGDCLYSEEDLQIFHLQRVQLYQNLHEFMGEVKPYPYHVGPFEVPGTRGQSSNEAWHSIRLIHATSSTCHEIRHFQKASARMNFLRRHMWRITGKTTIAMNYGTKNEPEARKSYLRVKRNEDPSVHVHEEGTIMNTKYVGLCCSHDGRVTSSYHVDRVLEIKCPFCLKGVHPKNFDIVLKDGRLSKFYLERDKDGNIQLKKNSKYYDQIQMEMALTELDKCDFVVWSEKGILIITVPFDEGHWNEIQEDILKFHWEYMAIEYFAMKTPRLLEPLQVA